jgi:Predicted DNA-binding protein containing a Zn-ribbon domain
MTLMKTIKDFLNNQIFIGIDDSDSKIGGCTTFVGYLLIKELIRQGINVVDIPRLIRLNPNVPWKTRGNGAVGITVYSEDIDRVYNVAVEILQKIEEEVASMPALVLIDQKQREFIEPIIKDAINRIIEPELVDKVIEKAKIIKYAKRRLGLVGALAAATLLLLEGDYTYELLAYRKPEFIGTKRKIDIESVRVIDRLYRKYTFNNIDGKRLLLTPHGKDPVLYGIRGEDPKKLIEAKKFIVSEEPLGWMVYITNQATDQHYVK